MPTATPRSHRREIIDATDRGRLAITDGEINFLWGHEAGIVCNVGNRDISRNSEDRQIASDSSALLSGGWKIYDVGLWCCDGKCSRTTAVGVDGIYYAQGGYQKLAQFDDSHSGPRVGAPINSRQDQMIVCGETDASAWIWVEVVRKKQPVRGDGNTVGNNLVIARNGVAEHHRRNH